MFSRQTAYNLVSQLSLLNHALLNCGLLVCALSLGTTALAGFSSSASANTVSAATDSTALDNSSPSAAPKPIATDTQLAAQRALYTQSLKLIGNREWQKLRRQRTQLIDYPLYPYLLYADLIADLRYARRHEVGNYLRRYKGSVKAQHLRARWLDYLARRAYWQAYTEYYDPQTASVGRQCNFYLAQYRLDNKPLAISEGLKLWSAGKSQPQDL